MVIEFRRIALTHEQIKRYNPPSLPVNMKDSRAEDYIDKYGDRCWEVEALSPETLLELTEEDLRRNVPNEYLLEAESKDQASNIAKPIIERLRKTIERQILKLLQRNLSKKEILEQLQTKYSFITRKT
jgi:hypothetical protein